MSVLNKNFHLYHYNRALIMKNIKSSIFQGTSLSLLIVCIALILLRSELSRTEHEHKIGDKKISNLFYVNDLRHYGKDNSELEGLLYKCANETFQKGQLKTSHSVVSDVDIVIETLKQEQTYK